MFLLQSRKVVPSRLRRSQSVDIQVRQFKRSDSCRDESFLVQNKRWKPGQSYDDSSKLVFSQQVSFYAESGEELVTIVLGECQERELEQQMM